MININQSLLTKVTDSEAWLLMHMVSAINLKNGEVVLKNKTISERTGYSITKINRLKETLSNKGILEIHNRTRTDGGDACNSYCISSEYIGLYVGQKDLYEYKEDTGGVFTSEQGGCSPVNRGGVQNVGGTYSSIDSISSIDLDNKNRKGAVSKNSLSIPDGYHLSVQTWLDYKRELKKPYKTQRTTQAMVDKLVRLSDGKPEVASLMIQTAIENGWQGFFKPTEETTTKETIHIAYEYACCMAGVKTEKERRWFLKEIMKYPAEFIGVLAFYWKNAHEGEMKRIIEQHLIEEFADKKRYYGNYNRKTPEEHIAHWTKEVERLRAEQ